MSLRLNFDQSGLRLNVASVSPIHGWDVHFSVTNKAAIVDFGGRNPCPSPTQSLMIRNVLQGLNSVMTFEGLDLILVIYPS